MAAIVDLLQNVAQKVRRCPTPTLVHAYRSAAIEFCTQSRWLRRTIEPLLEVGDQALALTLESADAGLRIIGTRGLRAYKLSRPQNDWPLPPQDSTLWRLNQPAAQPRCYAYQPESSLIFPAPSDAEYVVRVVAQVTPTDTTADIPDDLLAKWQRKLDEGALSYLFAIEGQSWTDKQAAVRSATSFQAAINNAKADEARSYNTGTTMARIPRVF